MAQSERAAEFRRVSAVSGLDLDTDYYDADVLQSDLMAADGRSRDRDLLQLRELAGEEEDDDGSGVRATEALLPHRDRQRKQQQSQDSLCKYQCGNKALLGNGVSLVFMIIGVILTAVYGDHFSKHCPDDLRRYTNNSTKLDKECIGYVTFRMIRLTGLFMLSGGVTNWIAVEMLFRKVPGLIGSGVIVRHFEEIRETVKSVVLDTFFEPVFMQQYIDAKTDEFLDSFHLDKKLGDVLNSPFVDKIMERQLCDVFRQPQGLLLLLMGISKEQLRLHVKPFIVAVAHDFGPVLIQSMRMMGSIDAQKLHKQIERMMVSKVDEMSPQRVRKLIEQIIRKHLGWLVVWGNVFGAIIGFLAEIAVIYATGKS